MCVQAGQFDCKRGRYRFYGNKHLCSPEESQTLQHFVIMLMKVSIYSKVDRRSEKANNKMVCFLAEKGKMATKILSLRYFLTVVCIRIITTIIS